MIGPEGKPIAGATVILAAGYRNPLESLGGQAERPLAVETTDAHGDFAVNIAPPARDRAGGAQNIIAVLAPGMALYLERLHENSARIVLARAAPTRGIVVDASGKPVAGLKLLLLVGILRRGIYFIPPIRAALSTQTGSDGTFTFHCLAAGRPAPLKVDDPLYLQKGRPIAARGGAATPLRITVYPAAQFQGRVIQADGHPVPGVLISFTDAGQGLTAQMLTDKAGHFQGGGLPGGHYTIEAADSKARLVAMPSPSVELSEGKLTQLPPILMTTGALIQGSITDAETGAPLPGTPVSVSGAKGNSYSGLADNQGHFSLRVPPGTYTVRAVGENVHPLGGGNGVTEATVSLPRVGSTQKVGFTFWRGLTLRCRFVGENGRPIPGVALYLVPPDSDHSTITFSVPETPLPRSDARGILDVDGLPRDGKPLEVIVSPGWEVVSPKTLIAANRRFFGPVTIHLRPTKKPS